MAKQDVRQKAAKGVIWTTVQKFAGMGISFISGIILARLLMPEDYGAIGMLSIFMVVAQQFMDGGFGTALIQKKNPTQEDYSTVFWWNLGLSIILYAILFFCAPPISRFYDMPILSPVLRFQALILIISALNMVQSNRLVKQFRFKEIAIVSLGTSVVSLAVTIVLAYKGYGVWSLVVQNILMAFIPMVAYLIIVRWHPSFTFSKESFKGLFSFGVFVFLSHIINKICNNIQGLLIGKIYNAGTMGYYSKARSAELLASRSIEESLTRVTFPLYAEYQDNKPELANLIKKLTTSVAYITFPLMLLLLLLARPIFLLLYSERWLPCVPYFQILCLGGLAICMQSINLQAISAIGKSKIMFRWTLIKRSIGLVLMIGALWLWGIYGLLWASVITSWLMYLINAALVSKHIGYKFIKQMMDLLPIMAMAVVSFGVSWGISHIVGLGLYTDGALRLVVFATCYLGLSLLFKIEAFDNSKQLIRRLIKR